MKKQSLLILLIVILTIVSATAQHSWIRIKTCTNYDLTAVDFLDTYHGIIVGENGTIIITTDGGFSWKLLNSGVNNHLNAVSYINDTNIIIAGDNGLILCTTDSGETWKSMRASMDSDLLSVDMLETGQGVIGGDSLTLLATHDFGETWVRISKNGEGRYRSVKIFDEKLAFAFGDNSRSNNIIGRIDKFQNVIITHEYQVFNGNNYSKGSISDGYPLASDTIIAVGEMYNQTNDGKLSYIVKSEQWISNMWLPVLRSDTSIYKALDMNYCYGIAVGAKYNHGMKGKAGLISETSNQGKDWIDVICPAITSALNDVKIIDNIAYVVGNEGLIMKKEIIHNNPNGKKELSEAL